MVHADLPHLTTVLGGADLSELALLLVDSRPACVPAAGSHSR